jgi:hypothetical protein
MTLGRSAKWRVISFVVLPISAAALGAACASRPAPKMCSDEAPPHKEKEPVVIGMCTAGPAPTHDEASPSDAGPEASGD